MAELTKEQKQYLVTESVTAVERTANLRGMTLATMSETMRGLLVDVFIAGANVALQAAIMKDAIKKEPKDF